MARVVDTDNHGSDYPDEKFVTESIPLAQAETIAAKLNEDVTDESPRWYKVVEDNYKLLPAFEP